MLKKRRERELLENKIPKWLCFLICLFIPKKHNRQLFRDKYLKQSKLKALKNEISNLQSQVDFLYLLLETTTKTTDIKPVEKIKKHQMKLLEILVLFDKICRKHSIPYWLEGGTLLGAVRHQSFVPWDDDIDVSLLRSDYEKIAFEILPKELKDTEYHSFIDGINADHKDNHPYQVARICKKGEEMLCLDFFPYDYYYKKIETEDDISEFVKIQKSARRKYKSAYFSKSFDYQKTTEKITKEFINKNIKVDISKEPALIRGIEFYTSNHKNRYRNYDWIFPLRELELEGHKFFVPNKYHEYLKSVYGKNYMNFPRRMQNHIDFNKLGN